MLPEPTTATGIRRSTRCLRLATNADADTSPSPVERVAVNVSPAPRPATEAWSAPGHDDLARPPASRPAARACSRPRPRPPPGRPGTAAPAPCADDLAVTRHHDRARQRRSSAVDRDTRVDRPRSAPSWPCPRSCRRSVELPVADARVDDLERRRRRPRSRRATSATVTPGPRSGARGTKPISASTRGAMRSDAAMRRRPSSTTQPDRIGAVVGLVDAQLLLHRRAMSGPPSSRRASPPARCAPPRVAPGWRMPRLAPTTADRRRSGRWVDGSAPHPRVRPPGSSSSCVRSMAAGHAARLPGHECDDLELDVDGRRQAARPRWSCGPGASRRPGAPRATAG